MKLPELKIFLFLTIVLSQVYSLLAEDFTESNFKTLSNINSQWTKHLGHVPTGPYFSGRDEQNIRMHLKLVSKALYQKTPKNLSEEQFTNRIKLIQVLSQYADAQVFPTNHYHATRRPYFVDNFGVHCAVGYLMAESGYTDLVAQIREEHNYDYIADIKTEGVAEWAEKHGFTIDELKWIQPTYPPSTVISPIGTGTNGIVNEVRFDVYGNRIIISGNFTTLNDLPCLNVGYFKDGEVHCLADGVAGEVESVITDSDGVFAFGALEDGATIYPAAFYDGVDWTFLSIPGRDSATSSAVTLGGSGYYVQAAISHDSIPGKQEIWFLNYSFNWEKKAMVTGVVEAATFSSIGRIFVGHFDSLFVFDPSGAVIDTYEVTNIAIKENWGTSWYGLMGDVSDTLKAVKEIGGTIYFGGTCSNNAGTSNICMTRYLNGVFQPVFLKQSYMGAEDFSVNTIEYKYGSNVVVVGGKFSSSTWMVGTYGNNLAVFSLISSSLDPQAIFDAPVNSVAYMGNTLYIGGEFSTNMTFNQLNHLARIISYTDIDENAMTDEVQIYPNPFVDHIQLNGIMDGSEFILSTISGQIVRSGIIENQRIDDLNALTSGTYVLTISNQDGIITQKITK